VTATVVGKRVELPEVGDMLTDGEQLIEVVGRCREGFIVLDVHAPPFPDTLHDPDILETWTTERIVKGWRIVHYERYRDG
jgi:hypothetical protein